MKRIFGATLAVGLAALVVFAGIALSSSSGRASITRIHVVELFTHDGSVDVPPAGPSQGDYLVWNDALVKPGTKQIVGHTTGTCVLVNVTVGLYNCPGVTFALADGQIQSPGLLSLSAKKPGIGPIVGGTGAYAGAFGETKGTPIGTNKLDWVLTVIKRPA
jgi:hypothetical protein